jgi:hypothetical protein
MSLFELRLAYYIKRFRNFRINSEFIMTSICIIIVLAFLQVLFNYKLEMYQRLLQTSRDHEPEKYSIALPMFKNNRCAGCKLP